MKLNSTPIIRGGRLLGLLLAAAWFAGGLTAAPAVPNVLFVYLDDFGWRDTGFMGSDFYETPNLDALANEGLVFTQAYAGAANCAPSRACLLSGQYSPRHRIFNVGTRPRGKSAHRRLEHIAGTKTLDPSIRTWAHQLQKAGYRTAAMGKWHLSKDPIPYGFDENVGGTHSGGPPRGYYPPHPVPGLRDAPEGEFLTDTIVAQADDFIRRNAEKPWCLYLSLFAVHTPIQAKRELLSKYEAKEPGELHDNVKMATMIQAVDDGVGRLVATLREFDLDRNTVILFSSDNGGYGPATDMAPLKGYKGTYYEGGIRVPFFAWWPGVIDPGETDVPLTAVDLYPTICELAGAPLPEDQIGDGVSLAPLFRGEVSPAEHEALDHRPLFWHFPAYLQSYSVIDEQRDPLFRTRPCSILRMGDFKLHQYFELGDLELYNLQKDPGETRNLAAEQPEKTAELKRVLENWREQTGAPVPTAPNPDFDAQAEAAAKAKALRSKGS